MKLKFNFYSFSAILIIIAAAFSLLINAKNFNLTSDEDVYVPTGVRYIQKGDYIMNNEHPPANKLIAGLGAIVANPNLDPAMKGSPNEQWHFGEIFWFESGNNTDLLLFLGRLPFVILTLLMLVSVYLFFSRNFSKAYGLGALILATFNPNLLSHGALTTNDALLLVGVWFSFLASYNLIKKQSAKAYLLWSLSIAFLFLSKFSGAIFAIFAVLIPAVAIIWFEKGNFWKKIIAIVLTGIVALSVIWAVYLFIERKTVFSQESVQTSFFNKPRQIQKTYKKLLILPILRYKEGYDVVANHNKIGHNSFLNGQININGFKSYFLWTIWYKTPTLMVVFWVLGLAVAISKKRWLELSLALIGISFLAISSFGKIHIGVRHILPVYLLFAPLGAYLISSVIRKSKLSLFLTIIALVLSFEIYAGGGNTISYFSPLSGGYRMAYKHLADSNVDWGQELNIIAKYIGDKKIEKPLYSYNSGENPRYRRFDFTSFKDKDCADLVKEPVVIATVNTVVGLYGPYPCLLKAVDDGKAEMVGQSHYVFYGSNLK